MENKEKKQHKLIPGSKVRVSTVAIISVVLAVLLAVLQNYPVFAQSLPAQEGVEQGQRVSSTPFY